jgi:hypothetical protein
LIIQLKHFELNILNHPKLEKLSSLTELCRGLIEAKKSKAYHLINRLIRLVSTLLVFTAIIEQAFLTIKVVKIRLCNKWM